MIAMLMGAVSMSRGVPERWQQWQAPSPTPAPAPGQVGTQQQVQQQVHHEQVHAQRGVGAAESDFQQQQ